MLFGFHFFAFAEENRNVEVDREMGGMKKGSRIPAPKGKTGITPLPKTTSTGTTTIDRGGLKSGTTAGRIGIDTSSDKTGEVEDKHLFKADLEAEGVTSVESREFKETVPVGLGETTTETTTEVPTETQTQTETPIETKTETPTEPITEVSTETSSGPIIGADVGTDLESKTVATEVTVDTSGELEEKQILDADIKVENISPVEAEVGSAVDVTEATVVKEADITTEPVETVVSAPSGMSADVDTTGETIAAEADVGVEADVSGTSESEDVACDPADGLFPDASCNPPL